MLVSSSRYPYVQIQFAIRGHRDIVFAYIDTGFDGYLIIPSQLAVSLGPPDYVSRWTLGDSTTVAARDYRGSLFIVGLDQISMAARITCLGNDYLLGRSVIDRFRVTLDHRNRLSVEL